VAVSVAVAVGGTEGQSIVVADMIFTVGHSTRSLEELLDVLLAAGVETLVDVRTAPGSRRHPQFGREALAAGLRAAGIDYRHEKDLGGFRRPRPDSEENAGWDNAAFRGYADYMATAGFADALERLARAARVRPTTVMCAEAQWWRCHRRLIADALTVQGWEVLHLGLRAEPVPHELTSFAVVGADGRLRYPPAQGRLTCTSARRPGSPRPEGT
jgi:uncharacterized protein (DUF488 family)